MLIFEPSSNTVPSGHVTLSIAVASIPSEPSCADNIDVVIEKTSVDIEVKLSKLNPSNSEASTLRPISLYAFCKLLITAPGSLNVKCESSKASQLPPE